MRLLVPLVLALAITGHATIAVAKPRVAISSRGGVEVSGFPAISGDGTRVALVAQTPSSLATCDPSWVEIRIADVATGRRIATHRIEDAGCSADDEIVPADRRMLACQIATAVSALARGKFRSLRAASPAAARWKPPRMPITCEMLTTGDPAEDLATPEVSAHADRRTGLVLLTARVSYESCMCSGDDVDTYAVARGRRGVLVDRQ